MEALWGCNMQNADRDVAHRRRIRSYGVQSMDIVCFMGGRGVNPQFLKVFSPILRPICMGKFETRSEGFSKINIGGSIFMLELTATLGILPIYQNCSTNINWAWRTNFCKVTYLDHCHNHWCSDISAHNIQPERTESSFILYLRLMFTFSIDVNFPAIALLLAAASEMMSRGGVQLRHALDASIPIALMARPAQAGGQGEA